MIGEARIGNFVMLSANNSQITTLLLHIQLTAFRTISTNMNYDSNTLLADTPKAISADSQSARGKLFFRRGSVFISDSDSGYQRCDPRWNMAFDNWLAESAPLEVGSVILRLYHWEPTAITIGCNQRWERALDLTQLGAGEIAIRRITGGRAIYHDSAELTYSFVYQGDAAKDKALSPDVTQQLSKLVSESLAEALRSLGLSARLERRSGVSAHEKSSGTPIQNSPPAEPAPSVLSTSSSSPTSSMFSKSVVSPSCFDSTARYEITVGGAKVAAGAQRILGARYFQHGSIKLGGVAPHPALAGSRGDGVVATREAKISRANKALSLSGLEIKNAFESVLSLRLDAVTLSEAEVLAIGETLESLETREGLGSAENAMNKGVMLG